VRVLEIEVAESGVVTLALVVKMVEIESWWLV